MGGTALMDEVSELISDLSDIAQRQAKIIDRLFLLLMQHIQVEDIEAEILEMQAVKKTAAKWEP